MARPRSWRDVPLSNPTRGARYTPGGLAAWRSVAPPVSTSRRGRSGASDENKRRAEQFIREGGGKDDGFNLLNAGGKALLGALDVLDTPRAIVASGINELANAGEYGGEFDFSRFVENARGNITMGEALGLEDSGLAGTALGFGLDVAVDPLTYVGGAAARVGPGAGAETARQFLKPSVKNFLGEAAVSAAERKGVSFADDAARAAEVARQGEKLAAEGAQKTLKYRSNQVLDALEREAVGAHPGTYVKIPGTKRLGVDKLLEKIVPERVVEATRGGRALRVTKRELGLGKLAGKTRAKVTQSALGNRMAEVFTKYPDLRRKILFGTPDEAAIAFIGGEKASAAQLQRRLAEITQGSKLSGLLQRAKKAGVNGEDLRYALAEAVDVDDIPGDSSSRVLAKVVAANDPDLLDEFRQFFRDLRDYGNSIDPELPWLQYREGYTTRTPSDEAIALRGGHAYSSPGGALRRETFDFKREYGLEPDQISEFMGETLRPPSEAGGRSVERQIDDILEANDLKNLFQKDAYKAFPDYVRRFSKRYGDEWMAKQLRDLGIAQPGWVEALTERGMTQGRVKAAIQSLTNRAAVRAEKKRAESLAYNNEIADVAALPAPEPGMVRLYRGESAGSTAAEAGMPTSGLAEYDITPEEMKARWQELRGQWWTDDPEYARTYSKGGPVRYIDVPEDVAAAQRGDAGDVILDAIAGGEGFSESAYIIPEEMAAKYSQGEARRAAERNLGASRRTLAEISGDKKRYAGEKSALEAASSVLDPDPVREYERLLRDHLDVLSVERQGLLDNIDMADVQVGLANDAQVALSHRIAEETQAATERVTSLEAAIAGWEDDLADLYDRMYFLNEGVTPDAIRSRQVLEELERNEAQIAEISQKMRDAEDLLAKFEDLADVPTDGFDRQLEQVDRMLAEAQEQYAADPRWISKLQVLSEQKATLLHQKGIIERARGRVADLDRADPSAWLDELDSLQDANAMGDKIIHSLFPDLPDEVNGLRLREFMNKRIPELENLIDDTRGQVMSAFSDRDTMRVQLAEIRAQRRLAEKNLASVARDITPRMREIWESESVLLEQADAAAMRALEIEDELRQAQEALGTLDITLRGLDTQEKVAEMFVAQQKAKHLQYEAKAIAAESDARRAKQVEKTWAKIAKANLSKPEETALVSALNENFRQLGTVSMIGKSDDWLVDALRSATIMNPPGGLKPALKVFDRVQNLWKGYALSTPGSINRNLFGGVFNNWLAGGVEASDYAKTLSWIKGGGRGLSQADREVFEQLEDAGLLVSAGSVLEVERRAATPSNLNPLSTDNKVLRFFRGGQETVEELLRGSLAFSTLKRGGDIQDAIGRVIKYHFDYDDLSAAERSVFRRIVPFYTWTRKNFPLMLEQIVQEPAKFTRFYQLKNEIELQSPKQTLVPSYFAENLAVRLPFEMQGSRAYMLPDLPFTSLNDVTDPSVAFSQVSPFIKTPIEYAFGKQFFKGIPLKDEYRPVPKLLTAIPGVMEALDAVGWARRGPNGWSMKQKDLYVLEQFIPSYGKARRLFPTEKQYNERVTSAWLSFALGAGIRLNTPTDQRNEAYRRIYKGLESAQSRRELGYVDYGYTDEGNVRNPPSAYALYNAYEERNR